MSANIIENETLADRVCNTLRNEIINKTLKAGERITIKEISERYGVSNMPVREAFRVLEGEALLKMSAYKGATVLALDRQYIYDVYGILRGLECIICESAVENVNDEIIASMRELNESMAGLKDSQEDRLRFVDLNSSFHDSLTSRTSNKKAQELYHYYHKMIRSIRKNHKYIPSYSRIQQAVSDHGQFLELLEKRSTEGLKEIIDRHSAGAMNDFLSQYRE